MKLDLSQFKMPKPECLWVGKGAPPRTPERSSVTVCDVNLHAPQVTLFQPYPRIHLTVREAQ